MGQSDVPAGFYYDIKLSARSHSALSVLKLKVAQVRDKHFHINMRQLHNSFITASDRT